MNRSTSQLLVAFLIVLCIASTNCTNGQSYNNIYTEENWEERDKWQKPELIIQQLNIVLGDYVADLGSHEGYMTVKLADHVGIGGRVFAVDVNKYRLTQLRKNLESRELENVVIVEGEEDDPKLPENEIDAILILDTYHEIEDTGTVLGHIKSALRDDGRLVILEPIRDSFRGKSREHQEDKHEVELKYVKEDLEKAGFRIIEEIDPFIDRTDPKGDNLWVLVAVKG